MTASITVTVLRGFPFIDVEQAEAEAEDEWLKEMTPEMKDWFSVQGIGPDIWVEQQPFELEDGDVVLPLAINLTFPDAAMARLFTLTFG